MRASLNAQGAQTGIKRSSNASSFHPPPPSLLPSIFSGLLRLQALSEAVFVGRLSPPTGLFSFSSIFLRALSVLRARFTHLPDEAKILAFQRKRLLLYSSRNYSIFIRWFLRFQFEQSVLVRGAAMGVARRDWFSTCSLERRTWSF